MNCHTKGFTLIEVMSAMAIVSVIGALSYPAYQKMTTRAQVNSVIAAVGPVLVGLSNYYIDNDESFLTQVNKKDYAKYVGGNIVDIRTSYGSVSVTTSILNPENGNNPIIIGFFPTSAIATSSTKNTLSYKCTSKAINWPYLPAACQNSCMQASDYSNCSPSGGYSCYSSNMEQPYVSSGTYTKCIYDPNSAGYCSPPQTYYACFTCNVPTIVRGYDCAN